MCICAAFESSSLHPKTFRLPSVAMYNTKYFNWYQMRDEVNRLQEQLDKTQKSLKDMADDRDWWRHEAMRLKGNHKSWEPKPLTGKEAASAASTDLRQQAAKADLQRGSIRSSSMRSCQHLLEAAVIRDAIGETAAVASAATAADSEAESDQEDQNAEGQWDSAVVWQEVVAAGRKQKLKKTIKDSKLKH